jgi:N-acetylornithine carbamoyltransferase
MEHRAGAVMDADATEHMADGVPALEEYGDVLAVRAFAKLEDREEDRRDPVISAFRRYAKRPIVNLESALWHPLQSFADAATWMAHLGPNLRGRKLASPERRIRRHPMPCPTRSCGSARRHGRDGRIEGMTSTRRSSIGAATSPRSRRQRARVVHGKADGAEVVVAKSWSGWSATAAATRGAPLARPASWTVGEDATAARASPRPVRRNVEVDDAALDGPRSTTRRRARLWTAMACLEADGERS